MRSRAFRRHQAQRHMWRRLKEDRNQHYDELDCPCWYDKGSMARFKEQPAFCSRPECCGNPRRSKWWPKRVRLTRQELRSLASENDDH